MRIITGRRYERERDLERERLPRHTSPLYTGINPLKTYLPIDSTSHTVGLGTEFQEEF